jgi:uncharacterized membrane protein
MGVSGRYRLPWVLLLLAVLLGLVLRFDKLGLKPLWMDEVITGLFSSGHGYEAVPLEKGVSVGAFRSIFAFAPSRCADIADRVATQSVHPPLFFCWMHGWLALFRDLPDWVMVWRSLPALVGGLLVGVIYGLNRVAFGEKAAVGGAWVMALSPFAVYLSQEARHYTVPMVAIALGLMGMVRIQQDWQQRRVNLWVWLGWVVVNTLGFYIHYFCILATIAQIGSLLLWGFWQRGKVGLWVPLMMATATIGLTYSPWFARFISHIGRPETEWMKPFETHWWTPLMPIWQLLAGWMAMVVALPVEGQAIAVAVVMGLVSLAFSIWIGRYVVSGLKTLLNHPATADSTLVLAGFVAISVLEFLAIIFVLKKDITQVPRYNFVYFPGVCALLGAALVARRENIKPLVVLLAIAFLSSQFVVSNLAFQKPYQPELFAANINQDKPRNALVVMGYKDYQDVARGVSFALAIDRIAPKTRFLFLRSSPSYGQLFDRLAAVEVGEQLWVIGPGLRRSEFPQKIKVRGRVCVGLGDRFYRLGIPYQGYGCGS